MTKRNISATIVVSISLFALTGAALADDVGADQVGWSAGSAQGGAGTILNSVDSGATWTRQGVGQIANVDMSGVAAVDENTAWVVGSSDGYSTLYRTTDGGATWVRKGDADSLPDAELFKVVALDADTIWAVGKGAILHTNDGGQTWTNQCPPAYSETGIQGVWTTDGQVVWAGGGPVYDPDSDSTFALILKSSDGGATWQRLTGQDDSSPVRDWSHINGFTAADPMTAWAEGGGYQEGLGNVMLQTTDGGASWTAYDGGGILDGNEIHAVDANVVWAVNDGTIFRTLDGGQTWEAVGTSPNYTMGVWASSDQQAWACVSGVDAGQLYGEIHHTTDGGTTWQVANTADDEPMPPLFTIAFAPQADPPDPSPCSCNCGFGAVPATLAITFGLGVMSLTTRSRRRRA